MKTVYNDTPPIFSIGINILLNLQLVAIN